MGVRAKVYVSEVTRTTSGGKVKMFPVCRGDDNKEWSAATPSGCLELSILNDAALEQFVPGEELFVDFSPAPKGAVGMGQAS